MSDFLIATDCGADLPEDYLKEKFGDPDPERVSILIAHDPEHFDNYAKWHPDYVLSGHVHGGIVNIPFLGGVISPQLKFFPKYDAGLSSAIESESEAVINENDEENAIWVESAVKDDFAAADAAGLLRGLDRGRP